MSWLGVWIRAVITPAARRALPVWLGAGIVGAVIFGPTSMRPGDLTGLALRAPLVGLVLATTWLLLFVPTARLIVRADGATYLRSLPSPRWRPRVIAVVALVGLQLPWLLLWGFGDPRAGAVIVVVLTGVIALVAAWRARPPRVGALRWRSGGAAFRGIYLRALRRRASDALVRAGGLAILAGVAGGLFVRNNEVGGAAAGVLATAVIAVLLTPGWVGTLLPLVDAHRASGWLAASVGMTERARIAVLATMIAGVYVVTTVIAVSAAAVVVGGGDAVIDPLGSILWIAVLGPGSALGLALVMTRGVVWAERSEATAARVAVGAIVATAIAVISLGAGGALGAIALAAIGILALGTLA